MNRFVPRFLSLLALATAAHGEIEFTGILTMSGKSRFALTDTAVSRTDWVALQGSFAGFVVASFDPATDTLTLTRDSTTLRVRLKDDAKIKASRFELTGSITFGIGEKVEIERATLLFDQENIFPLKDGVTYRITPTRRPDGTHRYDFSIEKRSSGNGADQTYRLSAPSVITLPGHPFSFRVGDFGFSFTPKSR